ncbi:MAG: LuxR C-terminal-related transcriptional regulator [Pseudomonadota bacterium]
MVDGSALPTLTSEDLARALMDISAAQEVRRAWDIYADTLATLGFVRCMYGCAEGWHGAVDEGDVILLYRGPPGFGDIYLDEQLYLGNPVFEWCVNNEGFMATDELMATYDGPVTPQLARLAQLRDLYGSRSGYFGSLRGVVPGIDAAVTMNPPGDMDDATLKAIWAAHGEDVEALTRALHLRVCTLPHPVRRPLSSRQREVLEWASQGKTVRDIACIMQISAQTVEKHLRLAREALEAVNTPHAVRKALQLRLLDTHH